MAKANELRILLVQAGGTDWDREGRLAGVADLPMSADERTRLGGSFGSLPSLLAEHGGGSVDVVICGPDEGSRETGDLVARAFDAKVKPVVKLADLNVGLWEGRLQEDLEERCPRSYRQWIEDPASVTPPQGESAAEAEDRVLAEIAKIADKVKSERPTIAVVLRPTVYALVRCWVEGLPSRSAWNVLAGDPNDPMVVTVARARFDRARAGL
ncbi:MAG: histidine phosphatase family protein [Phycisphaerales bacterium]